jgi:hypothetical protein
VLDPESRRGVALRVEIDDEHAGAGLRERRREVHRRRGLADAALLVGDREDAGALREGKRLLGEGEPAAGDVGDLARERGRVVVDAHRLVSFWRCFT